MNDIKDFNYIKQGDMNICFFIAAINSFIRDGMELPESIKTYDKMHMFYIKHRIEFCEGAGSHSIVKKIFSKYFHIEFRSFHFNLLTHNTTIDFIKMWEKSNAVVIYLHYFNEKKEKKYHVVFMEDLVVEGEKVTLNIRDQRFLKESYCTKMNLYNQMVGQEIRHSITNWLLGTIDDVIVSKDFKPPHK